VAINIHDVSPGFTDIFFNSPIIHVSAETFFVFPFVIYGFRYNEQSRIFARTEKGWGSKLSSARLRKFFETNAKEYLTELDNNSTLKDDEFYRKLYEETAMSNLET
jgi:hypothetical protein